MGGGLGGGGMGGAGAGGLTLAHQATAMARPSGGPPPGASTIPDDPGMMGAAPPSASTSAALAADLFDKHQQQLNAAHVRDVARFPLVAIDLYAMSEEARYVAGFPPKQRFSSDNEEDEEASPPPQAFSVGTLPDQIVLKTTEQSHKTFRKWLSQDRSYHDLQKDVLAPSRQPQPPPPPSTKKGAKSTTSNSNHDNDDNKVVIQSPQQWLGMRRFSQAPDSIKSKVIMEEEEEDIQSSTKKASNPIAPEAVSSTRLGSVVMGHGSLDGTSMAQGDDYDRVVYKLKLCESKKALTVLPEEMTKLLVQTAQHDVSRHYHLKVKQANNSNNKQKQQQQDELDPDDIPNYPCAVAVPSVYCHDGSIEALLEAMGGTGVVFQRSICALQGALMENQTNQLPPNQSMFVEHLRKCLAAIHKQHQLDSIKDPGATLEESLLILLTGIAQDCAEATAVLLSQPRSSPTYNGIIWGDFKVLTNVSYRSPTPEKMIQKCISELFDTLDTVAPEAGTPAAFLSYGSLGEQGTIQTKWKTLQKTLEDWEEVPSFPSQPQSVAVGTAFLGAVSHGRVSQIVQLRGKKPKADLAIHIHNVSPCAVGVMMNYHGGGAATWTPVKTVFDFDRRVPAGPYGLDLVAAECVVYRENPNAKETLSDEELVKAIEANQGAKYIPKREQAALDLRVQIMQKWTRDGEWHKVGNEMSPLVTLDKDEKKTACEKVVLELSLGTTGMITNAMTGER